MNSYRAEEGMDTPYKKAKQVWDQRIGTSRQQAANWRLVSLGLLCVTLLLSAGLIYMGSQSKIVPYVVEVSSSGQVNGIRMAGEIAQAPSRHLTQFAVKTFIQSVRSLPSDPVVARSNWEGSYSYLTSRGASILTGIFNENDPVAEFGKKTRQLYIDTILPLSNNTFQAEWSETEYDKSGIRSSVQRMRGAFTVLHKLPETEAELRMNPLGIYIDNFSWSPATSGGK